MNKKHQENSQATSYVHLFNCCLNTNIEKADYNGSGFFY